VGGGLLARRGPVRRRRQDVAADGGGAARSRRGRRAPVEEEGLPELPPAGEGQPHLRGLRLARVRPLRPAAQPPTVAGVRALRSRRGLAGESGRLRQGDRLFVGGRHPLLVLSRRRGRGRRGRLAGLDGGKSKAAATLSSVSSPINARPKVA